MTRKTTSLKNDRKQWTIWIDEAKKIISVKEIPDASKICFTDWDLGLIDICSLTQKGYRIG